MGIGKHKILQWYYAKYIYYDHFIQGKTINTFSKSNLKSTGFTGVEVFNEKMEDVFKGTTAKESFLHVSITDPISKRTKLFISVTLSFVHFNTVQKTTHF